MFCSGHAPLGGRCVVVPLACGTCGTVPETATTSVLSSPRVATAILTMFLNTCLQTLSAWSLLTSSECVSSQQVQIEDDHYLLRLNLSYSPSCRLSLFEINTSLDTLV